MYPASVTQEFKKARPLLKLKTKVEVPVAPSISRSSSANDLASAFKAEMQQMLKKMSEETGGRLFRTGRRNSLDEAFRQLQEELRNQYAIGYTPPNEGKNGAYRKIEIRMRDKEWKVQARKGYFAVTP